MKSVTLFLFLFPTFLFSQQDWPVIGAKWIQNDNFYYGWPYTFHTFECTGDTTINNIEFRIIDPYIFIHQDEDQFFYLHNDSLRLLYDFGVEAGDTVQFELLSKFHYATDDTVFLHNYVIDSVTTLTINNIDLKRVYSRGIDADNFFPNQYIYTERIGSERRIVEDATNAFWVADAGPSQLRCYIDDEIEYHTGLYYFLELDSCFATEPVISLPSISIPILRPISHKSPSKRPCRLHRLLLN